LHHPERAGIHAEKNHALFAVAKFPQILFVRSPRVIEWIIDMRDRRLEFQTVNLRRKFPRRRDEVFAFA